MFVKTKFETIVNVAEFDTIKIEWSVKESKYIYHIIYAVSEKRTDPIAVSATSTRTSKSVRLAQFPQDMKDQAQKAYDALYSALFQEKGAFDITDY
jgi:hypothetical protein